MADQDAQILTDLPEMTRRQYERNYARLEALMGQSLCDLRSGRSYKLRAPGFMDLTVELLPKDEETGSMVLSLCHYFIQNGDLCQDPEMTVRVFSSAGMIEALTFQQAIPPIYSVVYPEPGKVDLRMKQDLNAFLSLWLRNLTAQGHQLKSG